MDLETKLHVYRKGETISISKCWNYNLRIDSNFGENWLVLAFPLRFIRNKYYYPSLNDLISLDKANRYLFLHFTSSIQNKLVQSGEQYNGVISLNCASRCLNMDTGNQCEYSESEPIYILFLIVNQQNPDFFVDHSLIQVEPIARNKDREKYYSCPHEDISRLAFGHNNFHISYFDRFNYWDGIDQDILPIHKDYLPVVLYHLPKECNIRTPHTVLHITGTNLDFIGEISLNFFDYNLTMLTQSPESITAQLPALEYPESFKLIYHYREHIYMFEFGVINYIEPVPGLFRFPLPGYIFKDERKPQITNFFSQKLF